MYMDHISLLKVKMEKPTIQFGELAIYVSSLCQLDCQFCTIKNVKKTIRVNVVKKVLEANPVNIVAVGDGEPTCAEPGVFKDLCNLFANQNSKLITNGVRMPKIFNSSYMPFKHVRVSMDAGSADTYSKVKGVNAYIKIIQSIKKYLDVPTENVGASFVITKDNIQDIPDFLELCLSEFYSIYPDKFYVHFKLLYPYGYESCIPSRSQVDRTMLRIKLLRDADPWMAFFLDKASNYSIIKHSTNLNKKMHVLTNRCYASQMTNVLSSDGEVYPCNVYSRNRIASLGNVNIDGLQNIFERQFEFFHNNNPVENSNCIGCSQIELNKLLCVLLDSKHIISSHKLSQTAVRNAIIYHLTSDRVGWLGGRVHENTANISVNSSACCD